MPSKNPGPHGPEIWKTHTNNNKKKKKKRKREKRQE
jgi:hypothetical protein